ncbi:hypothetical protein PV08_00937 [Exophiala spinifera]|uniref:Uncharacterized protein n=1 Tax=Exophiala spinifera TaxID=91928 RepID=A0A0D2A6E8_9EURO|nr:uncharacterized protein PV08_00937 [Exophiala spinifera]KIW20362.1 hypothetical protein PV08_00937 [Exophiala spinifera]
MYSLKGQAPLAPEAYAPILSTDVLDATSRASARLNTQWNPLFLRRWVLVVFALFFAAAIAAVQILYSVSRQNNGVATSDNNKHYLWTYGPTAVFVLVTVLWRQVDYAAKSIQPWAEMARKPQPAQNSLLLDYITPFQVVALWKSLRRRHFTVSCTIAVFFLLKVVTVISTGIFSLQSVQRNDVATTMRLNNTFDGSSFNQAASVDSRAAYIVYADQQYNVSLPVGTTNSFASQSFSPSTRFINGSLTYTASVDVFSASLEDCQSGTLAYNISFDEAYSNAPVAAYYNTTVSLPGCEITNAHLDAPDWYYMPNSTAHYFGYRGSLQNVSCSNLPEDDSTRNRYMVWATYSEGFSQNNFTMLNSSNVICLPSYSIQKAMVTLDTLGNVQAINLTGDRHLLSGVTANDVAQGVMITSQQANYVASLTSYSTALDTFVALMRDATPDFDPEQLLDPSYLDRTGSAVFGSIAAQLANIYLLTPSSTSGEVQGTVSESVNRLFASNNPIRAMQGVLAAVLLLTLIVLFIVPRGVVPRSVDSIAAVAAILSRSPALERRLRGTGHMSLAELEAILEPYKFMTSLRDQGGSRIFEIQLLSSDGSGEHTVPNQDSPVGTVRWTRPFVLRRLAVAFTIFASVAVIVTLEVLLSESHKNQGLGTVHSEDTATRYSWLYIPVLVFLFLGTLFNVMDFEIEFSESYHSLTKGDCDASSTMFWNPLRHVSLYSTWNGLKHSKFALTAASTSAILAPFLTIVVAGLFSTKAIEYGTHVNTTALDWFNTTPYTDPATNIPALVIEGNMSYPQWTYNELAFPQLQLDNREATTDSFENPGSIYATVPALRAAVSCSVIPDSRISQNELEGGYLISNISTPEGCGNSGYENTPNIYLTNNIQVPVNSSGYFGQTVTLSFNAASCPTIALYYGHVTDDNEMDHFAAFLCSQAVDRVQANVTLDLPRLSISTEPVVAPDSAVHFSSWYAQSLALQVLNISSTSDMLDQVFTAMVYGRDGVPPAELLDNDKLVEAYTHFYRQYTAQLANIYLRAEFSTLSGNATETVDDPLSAVYVNPNHYRLMQSSISTQILVGVVSALLVCAVMIIFTVDMRNVLPKPMGSVASVASLLAGSRIVDPQSGLVPEGSEFWSDGQWERSGIWQGEMFRMGWWDKFQQPCETWHGELDDNPNKYMAVATGGKDDYALSAFNGGEGAESHDRRSFRIDARPRVVS